MTRNKKIFTKNQWATNSDVESKENANYGNYIAKLNELLIHNKK